MKKTGLEELEQFTMTRGEYAKELGITPNAVRMRMRTGKLSGEYRFDGNKYLFRTPETPRDNIVNTTGINTTPKKRYNRGNHFKADYPNDAFRLHNEHKKEQAILNKIQGKFKSEAHRLEYEKLNNEALKKSLENTQKIEKNSFTPLIDYGGPIRARRRDRPIVIDAPFREPRSNRRFSYYEIGAPSDDGSVEIDLSQSRSSNSEPRFSSKVEESIWRLRNKK